jgi:hypothetical protein
MTLKWIILLTFFTSSLAFAQTENCDLQLKENLQTVDENPVAYVVDVFGFKVKVGGAEESRKGTGDFEAVSRMFTRCSPGIVKCLKRKKRRKISGTIWADLEFTTQKEALALKSVKFSSSDTEKSGFYSCAEEVILKYGYPSQFPVSSKEGNLSLRLPIVVTPTCGPVPNDLQQDDSCATGAKNTPPMATVEKLATTAPVPEPEKAQNTSLQITNFKDMLAFTYWGDPKDRKNDLVSSCFKISGKMIDKLNGYENCAQKTQFPKAFAECTRKDNAHVYIFKKADDCERAQRKKGIAEEL